MAQHQLLGHEPRLDRLAEAHVVGDEEVRPRHTEGPDHRIELVVLYVHAAPKRRLERSEVRRGDRPPPHGVKECVEAPGLVEAYRSRQGALLEGAGAGLELPDDPELLPHGVVLDGGERDEVLLAARILLEVVWPEGTPLDLGDHEPAPPDVDQLARVRKVGDQAALLVVLAGGAEGCLMGSTNRCRHTRRLSASDLMPTRPSRAGEKPAMLNTPSPTRYPHQVYVSNKSILLSYAAPGNFSGRVAFEHFPVGVTWFRHLRYSGPGSPKTAASVGEVSSLQVILVRTSPSGYSQVF